MAELVDAHDSKSCFARSESSILSSPTRVMELNKINSLVELFFKKYEEISSVSDRPFLKSLKNNQKNFLTCSHVKKSFSSVFNQFKNG